MTWYQDGRRGADCVAQNRRRAGSYQALPGWLPIKGDNGADGDVFGFEGHGGYGKVGGWEGLGDRSGAVTKGASRVIVGFLKHLVQGGTLRD